MSEAKQASGSLVYLGYRDALNQFVPWAGQQGLAISHSKEVIDDGDKSTKFKRNLVGEHSWEATLDAVYRAGVGGFLELFTAYKNDNEIDVLVVYPDGLEGTGKAILTAMDEDWQRNANGAISVTLTGNGEYMIALADAEGV